MRLLIAALALVAATPAFAADAAPQVGRSLHDANGLLLGQIDRVLTDGSVRVIVGDKLVTIPAATLKTTDGKTSTSLTKKEAAKL